jgi:hypothetical protein
MKNLNSKLDKRIEELSDKIISDFENKKAELIKMRDELNELYKVRNEINNINAFYGSNQESNSTKKTNKSEIKNIPYLPLENPYRSSNNLLTELKGIKLSINNGELLKKSYKTNTIESVAASELLNSDSVLSNYGRFLLKKNNNAKPIDNNKVLIESEKLNLVIDFNEHKVNPSNISVRYYFLPNENKFSFSFINSVLASNDGKNWETLCNINPSELKYFEKIPIFKWKLLNRKVNEQFYRYIAFEVAPFKEIVNTNQINKFANKLNVTLCGLEVFGDYYSEVSSKNLNNIDEQFEDFFDTYLQINQVEASAKTEIQFLIKMILDSFREINNVLTDLKSKVIVKQMLSSNDAASLMMPIENILESNSSNDNTSDKIISQINDEINTLNDNLEEECFVNNLLTGNELDDALALEGSSTLRVLDDNELNDIDELDVSASISNTSVIGASTINNIKIISKNAAYANNIASSNKKGTGTTLGSSGSTSAIREKKRRR